MIKFIFDLDGTITSAETLPIIAETFNVHKELIQLTQDTVAGKIPWKQSFLKRVEFLKHIPVNEVDDLLEKTPVYSGIANFINNNKDQCAIATGNLDCWIHKLCVKVGCDYYSSKARVVNNEVQRVTHVIEKADIVTRLQKEGSVVVFIGDSNNDVNAMRKANISIAYGVSHMPSKACQEVADRTILSENELVDYLVDLNCKK